jgi:hypothetical protein
LTIFPFELLECDRPGFPVASAPAPFRHRQQLGRHHGQIMIGLMAVGPGAQVHLGHRVQAMLGHGIEQRR